MGVNLELNFILFVNGKIAIIIIEATRAITPPSLLGMERKIAYANRKYHSGWIWIGVTKGFAGLKLSGSPNWNGKIKIAVIIIIITKILIASFVVKYGWNNNLSILLFIPIGLFDPAKCKIDRWAMIKAIKTKGIRKCKE